MAEDLLVVSEDKVYDLIKSTDAQILERARFKDTEISRIENILRENFPLLDPPYTHYFCQGLYAREMIIPAGALITGKIHLEDSISFMLTGEMLIFSSDSGVARLKAPQVVLSSAGTRRVAFALADVRFVNVMANAENIKDLKQLENLKCAASSDDLALKLQFKES